jgi:hypothetical protein
MRNGAHFVVADDQISRGANMFVDAYTVDFQLTD